jgi:hypothetical protein
MAINVTCLRKAGGAVCPTITRMFSSALTHLGGARRRRDTGKVNVVTKGTVLVGYYQV